MGVPGQPVDASKWPRWSVLVLAGLGGAGKSALLTRFLADVERANTATLAVFDFDRPGLSPHDRPWLNAELVRQVGRQHPEAEERLRDRRRQTRETYAKVAQQAPPAFGPDREAVGFDRSTDDLLHALIPVLLATPFRPLLLVFDTLEQVADAAGRGALREWAAAVADVLHPVPVKLILSGRLFDADRSAFLDWGATEVLELDELPRPAATALLRRFGLSQKVATAAVRSTGLPRRPLELRLLATLVAQTGTTAADLSAADGR